MTRTVSVLLATARLSAAAVGAASLAPAVEHRSDATAPTRPFYYTDSVALTGVTARRVTCNAGCGSGILKMSDNTITVPSHKGYAVWSDARFPEFGNVLDGRVHKGRGK